MRALVVTVTLASLACAGTEGPPPPPVAQPAPAEPEPGTKRPRPRGDLAPWQRPFAQKRDKNVRDYLMLLPADVFVCELERGPDTEAARDAAILERHVETGYLKVATEGVAMQVALYVDRAHHRDVIGLVKNGGAGNMCNLVQFQTWDEAVRTWREVDVLPRDAIEARVTELRGADTAWWPLLPVRGTDTDVVDEESVAILTLKWAEGRFAIERGP